MQMPTVGRKVWFWDFVDVGASSKNQPYDATIIYVWGPDCVNLDVTNHQGYRQVKTSVPLRDPRPEDCHGREYICTWMPYQKQQYEKEQAGS